MLVSAQISIARIFISPGHNFFGHSDQPAGTHPTVELLEVECVAGKGLMGDRFFDYKEDYKGQVTLFSQEVFDDVCRSVNVTGKSPGVTRRNLITRGMDVNTLIGREFEIQGVLFLGMSECKPCYWMDEAIGPGAEKAMQGRGGLRVKILTDGKVHVDA